MPKNTKGSAKFYCHKCRKQVENVIYSEDNSTNPPAQIWLCDKCNNGDPVQRIRNFITRNQNT